MSDSGFKRAHRVSQLIQKEMGRLLVEELKDPRIGFVTVTEVRVTDDLRSARVYVSVYGDEDARQASLEGLREAAGFIKRELFHRVRMKYSPNLTFMLDDSLDKVARLETLMSAIEDGAVEVPAASETPEAVPVSTPRSELAQRARELEEAEAKAKAAEPDRGRASRNRRRKRRRN